MAIKFSNNASTVISSDITAIDTSIPVTDASVFPALGAGEHTYVTLENTNGDLEIVKVTAISSNTLTVIRGQDGTTARAYSSGDFIQLRVTAALLNDLSQEAATTEWADILNKPDSVITLSGDVSGSGTMTDLGSVTITTSVSGYNNTNWDTAYSWGDHGAAGYLTSFTETDPVFSASPAAGISATNITNWNSAYGWGDHSTAGYLSGNQTITLSGDASGSGTTSIVVTVADDSHNHIIGNVDGLQTALDGKLGATDAAVSADKWTTARTVSLTGAVTGSASVDGSANVSIATTATADPTLTLSGDVTGSATFTNLGNATLTATVVDDSHNHIISNVDGLQTALDGKLGSTANAVSASKWATARTVSLTGAVTGSASVDGSADVSIATTHTADPTITLTGAVTGSGTMTNLGNVSIATTATADPTLTLSGDASGSATFTNLGNATLSVTVANDSHTHDGRYYTESESDSRFVNTSGDTMTGQLNATIFATTVGDSRDKFRVYPSSSYTIGMQSAISYGGLNDWAMTFQMNNDADRGFWWGHESHSTAQGAMSLTTAGHLFVGSRVDAPIFYDSGNTNYFVDPASNSSMWNLYLSSMFLNGEIYHNGDTDTYLQFHAADQFRVVTGGSERLEVNNTATTGSRIDATSNMRAPIFYDRNNTAYYIHADSTSILNNLRYNPDPGSISTAAHEGSINYVYNSTGGTPTRGDCSVHVYHCWSNNLSLSLTSSTWQQGDIVRVSNAKGAVNITVSATRIYLPDGSYDTSVTFNNAVGGFVLAKYTTTTGYWMVMA